MSQKNDFHNDEPLNNGVLLSLTFVGLTILFFSMFLYAILPDIPNNLQYIEDDKSGVYWIIDIKNGDTIGTVD